MAQAPSSNQDRRLQLFALWAEIVGAAAVVVSLIFVGLQIRQGTFETALNTRTSQVNAYQNLQAQITTINTLELGDAELRRVLETIRNGDALEDPLDRERYLPYARIWVRMGDLAYHQYENGLIDEGRLLSMLSPLRGEVLSNPTGLSIWQGYGFTLVPAYVEYVNEHLLPQGAP